MTLTNAWQAVAVIALLSVIGVAQAWADDPIKMESICPPEATQCIDVEFIVKAMDWADKIDIVSLDQKCPADTPELMFSDRPGAQYRICVKEPPMKDKP